MPDRGTSGASVGDLRLHGTAGVVREDNALRLRRFKVRGKLTEGLGLTMRQHGCVRLARSNVEPFVERNGVLRMPSLSMVTRLTCRDARREHRVCGDESSRNA